MPSTRRAICIVWFGLPTLRLSLLGLFFFFFLLSFKYLFLCLYLAASSLSCGTWDV